MLTNPKPQPLLLFTTPIPFTKRPPSLTSPIPPLVRLPPPFPAQKTKLAGALSSPSFDSNDQEEPNDYFEHFQFPDYEADSKEEMVDGLFDEEMYALVLLLFNIFLLAKSSLLHERYK
jgi:hypothetical protein